MTQEQLKKAIAINEKIEKHKYLKKQFKEPTRPGLNYSDRPPFNVDALLSILSENYPNIKEVCEEFSITVENIIITEMYKDMDELKKL